MDLAALKESWNRRWDSEAARDEDAKKEALAILPQLVACLIEGFGARAVVLVGSLSRGDFRADSDIDLVVAGLDPAIFWRAGASLERLSGRDVDLIPWEDSTAEMRKTVTECGKVLYGAL